MRSKSTGGQNPSIVSENDGKRHTLTMTKLVHRQPKIRKSQHDLYLIILIGKQTV